jgi:hypothetical protein
LLNFDDKIKESFFKKVKNIWVKKRDFEVKYI